MLRGKMRELDRKILLQLLRDSRQSVVQIARRVGASRQTVARKLEQLRESGVIRSFTVGLDPEKLGLGTRAYVFLQEAPQAGIRKENEEAVKKLHQVSGFYRLFGEYSAVLEVRVRDSRALTALVKKIHGLRGVRETKTFIVHSTVKDGPEEPFVEALIKGDVGT